MEAKELLACFLVFGERYYRTLAASSADDELCLAAEFQGAISAVENESSPTALDAAARLVLRLAESLHDDEKMWAFSWDCKSEFMCCSLQTEKSFMSGK